MNERRYIKLEKDEDDLEYAKHFRDSHIRECSAEEHEQYQRTLLKEWIHNMWQAEASHENIRPLWLRRNEGGGTYFGAVIDYVIPTREDLDIYATIYIHSESGPTMIELWLPKEDGSGEPWVAYKEMYDLHSLDQALHMAESYYQ